jgi:hypothetical protein
MLGPILVHRSLSPAEVTGLFFFTPQKPDAHTTESSSPYAPFPGVPYHSACVLNLPLIHWTK